MAPDAPIASTTQRISFHFLRSPLNFLATTLVCCSAVSNLVGAARLSEGLMLPVICAAALASDGLKAALPVVIRGKLRSEPVTAALLSVLAIACFMFSLSMALGSATGTRANAQADRQQQASTYASAKGAVDGVEAEIQKIGAQRSVAEVEAAQAAGEGVNAKLWIQTAKCSDITRTASQQACAMWLDLAKEKALSARLADLKASLPGLQAKLTNMKPVATGDDPQVVALQNVAGLFGLALPADKVAGWLSVLLVLILELGATLGPLAASGSPRAAIGALEAQTAAGSPALGTREAYSSPTEAAGSPVAQSGSPRRPMAATAAVVAQLKPTAAQPGIPELQAALRAAGGRWNGSQEQLAAQLGCKRSQAQRLLAAAADAGAIRLRTVKGHSTEIELAGLRLVS